MNFSPDKRKEEQDTVQLLFLNFFVRNFLYDRRETAIGSDRVLHYGSGTTRTYVLRQVLITTSPPIERIDFQICSSDLFFKDVRMIKGLVKYNRFMVGAA